MTIAGVFVAAGGRGPRFDRREEALGGAFFALMGLVCMWAVLRRRRRLPPGRRGRLRASTLSVDREEPRDCSATRFVAALGGGRPAVRATFSCAVCGEEAGAMQLRGSAARAELRRTAFTGTLTGPVAAAAYQGLRDALDGADAGRVFELDPEYAPFYCPRCRASYCGAHWDRWDVFDDDMPEWHDSIRGRCPRGHERMLED
jgi:hypothetical protein